MVVIDLFAESTFFHKYQYTPSFPFTVDSNMPFDIAGKRITIRPDRQLGYVSIEFDVGDITGQNRVKRSQYGKTKLDFKIVG
jgi:hypothetical protein